MIQLSKPYIGKEEIKAVTEVLKSGMLVQGPKVKELEDSFANMSGSTYAVATSNGTSALHVALHAIGIRTGDEVITTPFTFGASANSVLMTGAQPVFVDIDENTYNIDPEKIEAAITKKTRAIIAVDLYGQPADYTRINAIAKKNNLFVVEDAAQSVNARQGGKKSGSLADIACFSLYATKNIMSGEGGVITMNNKGWYEKAKLFRHHGMDPAKRYEYQGLGYNYRLTDLQAAIAIEQLRRLELFTSRRQAIARRYNEAFKNIKGLYTPFVQEKTTHVYHQYTIRVTQPFVSSREKLRAYLDKKGIQTTIYYPRPLYEFPHFNVKVSRNAFPVTEQVVKEIVSIPVHPALKDSEVKSVIKAIVSYEE